MGNLFFETNHPETAIKYHESALEVNDRELQALIGLANCHYDLQHHEEAVRFY